MVLLGLTFRLATSAFAVVAVVVGLVVGEVGEPAGREAFGCLGPSL
jgi:hypothetical protein